MLKEDFGANKCLREVFHDSDLSCYSDLKPQHFQSVIYEIKSLKNFTFQELSCTPEKTNGYAGQ